MPDRYMLPTPKAGPFMHGIDSQRNSDVLQGSLEKHHWISEVFPGTHRAFWVYVPAQYTPDKPANVMVFQDGGAYVDETFDMRVPIVFDNLIAQGKMPVTIAILINPGHFPAAGEGKANISNRSFEYDTISDQYPRMLVEEILPFVGAKYRLTGDPNGRAICGASSGGICSFNAAWHRPDVFSKVLSHVGSFADIRGGHVYPTMVRKNPKKPIRVYLQAGSNDIDNAWGHWGLANLQMAASFNYMGYEFHLEYGDGGHNYRHGGAILPESLVWLWRA